MKLAQLKKSKEDFLSFMLGVSTPLFLKKEEMVDHSIACCTFGPDHMTTDTVTLRAQQGKK